MQRAVWEVWAELPFVLECGKTLFHAFKKYSMGKVLNVFHLVTRARVYYGEHKHGIFCQNPCGMRSSNKSRNGNFVPLSSLFCRLLVSSLPTTYFYYALTMISLFNGICFSLRFLLPYILIHLQF